MPKGGRLPRECRESQSRPAHPEEPQGPSRGAAIEAALTMRPGGAVPPLGTLPGQPQPRSVVAERGVGPVAHAPHGRGGRLGRDRLERKAREVQPAVPRYARGWYARTVVRTVRGTLVASCPVPLVRVANTYGTEA